MEGNNMIAARALKVARDAGVKVQAVGNDLQLEAASEPPSSVIEPLRHNKADIVTLLRSNPARWSPEEWRAYFDERAAIAEYDGRLCREDAEALAFASCVVKWLEGTFVSSPPGQCLNCGGIDPPLQRYGAGMMARVYFHHHCGIAWRNARRSQAVAALKDFGIHPSRHTEHQSTMLHIIETDFFLLN
jgi:hypothetical protein